MPEAGVEEVQNVCEGVASGLEDVVSEAAFAWGSVIRETREVFFDEGSGKRGGVGGGR